MATKKKVRAKDFGDKNNSTRSRHIDDRFVSTSEPWEVEYAKKKGEITVDRRGKVHPVKGKTKKLKGRIERLKHPY